MKAEQKVFVEIQCWGTNIFEIFDKKNYIFINISVKIFIHERK